MDVEHIGSGFGGFEIGNPVDPVTNGEVITFMHTDIITLSNNNYCVSIFKIYIQLHRTGLCEPIY